MLFSIHKKTIGYLLLIICSNQSKNKINEETEMYLLLVKQNRCGNKPVFFKIQFM